MLAVLMFVLGAGVGAGTMFGLYARGVLKPRTKTVIVIDPEQGGGEPSVRQE